MLISYGVWELHFIFCPRGQGGGGDVKCPCLSTRGGEGVKIGQNLVHVVVECPLIIIVQNQNFIWLLDGRTKNLKIADERDIRKITISLIELLMH